MSLTWEEGREVGGREGCSRWEEVQQATLVWEESKASNTSMGGIGSMHCTGYLLLPSSPLQCIWKGGHKCHQSVCNTSSATLQYVSQYSI